MADTARRMAKPVAWTMLRAAISSTEAKPTPQATAAALISISSASRRLAESFLESSTPAGARASGPATATMTSQKTRISHLVRRPPGSAAIAG